MGSLEPDLQSPLHLARGIGRIRNAADHAGLSVALGGSLIREFRPIPCVIGQVTPLEQQIRLIADN